MNNLAEFFEEDSVFPSLSLFTLIQASMAEVPVNEESDDPIMDILQSNGVQYVHMNDAILEPSKVEEIVRRFPFDIAAAAQGDTQRFSRTSRRKRSTNRGAKDPKFTVKVIVKQARVILLGRLGVQRNRELQPDGVPLVNLSHCPMN
jgi:hypothetical protein